MSNIFNRLELQAFRAGITPRTKESRAWFQNKAKNLRNINREQLMKEEPIQQTRNEVVGSMYMFFYDPKTKDTLPYYDKFPLAIVVGPAEKGFYGLNLHYLPPVLRAKMLDALMDITNNDRYDNTTKFDLTYRMLKRAQKFRHFKPCFKHYLSDHVKSRFAKIPATEWEIATFLPTADFRKANNFKVYSDSKRMIGG